MNICIVNGFFPPHVSGSARLAFLLSRELAKQGHKVIVITSRLAGTETTEKLGTVTVHRLDSYKYPKTRILHNADLYWTLLPHNFRSVVSILKENHIEVVHAFGQFHDLNFMTVTACRLLNIPVVLSIHVRMEHPNPFLSNLFILGDKVLVKNLLAKRSSAIVALDRLMSSYIIERYGVDEELISFIPTAVDVDRFQRCNAQSVRRIYGLHKSQPVILSLGTMSNYRNPDALIRAFPHVLVDHPKSKLLLVGAVNTVKPGLLVKELGLESSVVFAGKVDYKMIPSYLGACDVEGHDLDTGLGIGLASLESMAAGRAVLSSARQDNFMNLQLENWKNIVLVRPGNIKDISNALTRLLTEQNLREKIGNNARKFVKKHFSLHSVASQYQDLYQKVISHK